MRRSFSASTALPHIGSRSQIGVAPVIVSAGRWPLTRPIRRPHLTARGRGQSSQHRQADPRARPFTGIRSAGAMAASSSTARPPPVHPAGTVRSPPASAGRTAPASAAHRGPRKPAPVVRRMPWSRSGTARSRCRHRPPAGPVRRCPAGGNGGDSRAFTASGRSMPSGPEQIRRPCWPGAITALAASTGPSAVSTASGAAAPDAATTHRLGVESPRSRSRSARYRRGDLHSGWRWWPRQATATALRGTPARATAPAPAHPRCRAASPAGRVPAPSAWSGASFSSA